MPKKSVIKVSAVETTEEFENILAAVEGLREDFVRFQRGNISAGLRLRKQILDIGKWSKEVRSDIIGKVKLLRESAS